MLYLFVSVVSIALSFLFVLAIRRLALFLKIQDMPVGPRKRHGGPVPLLGGLAPFAAFFSVSFLLLCLKVIPATFIAPMGWLFLSSSILMLGGFLDDKYSFPPKLQIWFPLVAIATALFGGIRIYLITNPAGGVLLLGSVISLILSFFWLLTITYTTKILDGLDGLVSGTTAIGAFTIFLFTTLTDFKETGLSYAAIALAGAFIGFLIFNFYPAKIFLGEGGSLFAGFILGSLAIMTGAKIAVTLMVLALPLIDLAAVVLKRLLKRKSIWKGDRLHLHYLLVDRGWKPQGVVSLFWGLSALMGLVSVFLPSVWKIISLIFISMIFFAADLFWFKER